MSADIVLINGHVMTVDPMNPVVSAVAIRSGRIVHVGSNEECRTAAGPRAEVIDLRGRTATPGLNDAHAHPMSVGQALLDVDITPEMTGSVDGIVRQLRTRLNGAHSAEWIFGRGYDQARMSDQRHPMRGDLDQVSSDRPVIALRACHHIAAVNSVALQIAGISANTGDPEGGTIDRDEHGEPTGVLRESAMELVRNHVPAPTEDQHRALSRAGRTLVSANWRDQHGRGGHSRAQGDGGLSAICVAAGAVTGPHLSDDDDRRDAGAHGRVSASRPASVIAGCASGRPRSSWTARLADELAECASHSRARPKCRTLDGAAGRDESQGHQGPLARFPGRRPRDRRRGDRPDSRRPMRKRSGNSRGQNTRHRIEHCSIVDFDTIQRIKRVGAVPIPGPPFYYFTQRLPAKSRRRRLRYNVGMRTYAEQGVIAAASTDAPVVPVSALTGLGMMMSRVDVNGVAIWPEEIVDLDTAIRAYTWNGAYASFEEPIKGSLEPGKLGDVTVFETDLRQVTPTSMKDVAVDYTIAEGRVAYDRTIG